MKVFNLPDLGEGLQDAEIVRWMVSEGDTLAVDQPMVEMETAKAVVEVPSPFAGVVTKLHGQSGDIINVGSPLVEFDGEERSTTAPQAVSEEAPPVLTETVDIETEEVFKLPDLGEGLQDAEIVRWLKSEGDNVQADEPIVEMETAKAVVEVPSPVSGVISTLHGQAGDVILVGAPLVSFAGSTAKQASVPATDKQEQASADAGTVVGAVEVSNNVAAEKSDALIKALARKFKVDLKQVTGTGSGGKITQSDIKNAAKQGNLTSKGSALSTVIGHRNIEARTSNPLQYKASPAVRALAGKLGVNLGECKATGKKGSITREDVQHAAQSVNATAQTTPVTKTQSTTDAQSSVGVVGTKSTQPVADNNNARLPSITTTVHPEPIRGARRAMAQAMSLASSTVCLTTLVDDANIHQWRKGNNPTVRLIRALAAACSKERALNAWFDGNAMERLLHPEVHIGIAVDMPEGLYVPVIRHADKKCADEIRSDLNVLIEKIKSKSIKPEDMANPTITLSNFGTIAGRYGTPVVVPPQVGILGAGSFKDELKLTERGIESQRHIPLSLSFDHRACTGGEAARCLKAIMDDLALPE